MDNIEILIRILECEIQDIIALRSSYMTYIIGLTGGAVSFFFMKTSVISSALCITCILLDILFIIKAQGCSKRIYYKKKEMEKYGKYRH